MRKTVLLITALIMVIIIVSVVFNFSEYIPEFPSRLAGIHNIINISVLVNEEPLDIENIEVQFQHENLSLLDTQKISGGKVKFKKGIYGLNMFNLKVPNENVGEIKVEFGHFNTNWWHICEYDVDVIVDTIDEETIKATLEIGIAAEADKQYYEITKILNNEDNAISCLR